MFQPQAAVLAISPYWFGHPYQNSKHSFGHPYQNSKHSFGHTYQNSKHSFGHTYQNSKHSFGHPYQNSKHSFEAKKLILGGIEGRKSILNLIFIDRIVISFIYQKNNLVIGSL